MPGGVVFGLWAFPPDVDPGVFVVVVCIAAAMGVCAVGVLRTSLPSTAAAIGGLAVMSLMFLQAAPLQILLLALLVGTYLRMFRAAGSPRLPRRMVRDRVVRVAGVSCFVAGALVGVFESVGLVYNVVDDVSAAEPELPWTIWTMWVTLIATPSVLLVVAAVGLLRGSHGWALVATGAVVLEGSVVILGPPAP